MCQAHILLKHVLAANIHDLTFIYLITSSLMSVILYGFLRHFVFGFGMCIHFPLLLKPLSKCSSYSSHFIVLFQGSGMWALFSGLSVQNSETAIKIMVIIMIRMSANSSEAQGPLLSSHSYWKN